MSIMKGTHVEIRRGKQNMKINVEFEHEWTVEEIEAFLNDGPDGEQYNEEKIDNASFIELAACAYCYYPGVNTDEINELAKNDICNGIKDRFFDNDKICEYYICYYLDCTFGPYDVRQILKSTTTPKDGQYKVALRFTSNYFLIHDHEEGWDYYLLDLDYKILRQGIFDDVDAPLGKTVKQLLDEFDVRLDNDTMECDFQLLYNRIIRN